MDEAGLLEGARKGDSDAFSRLFACYQGPIFRYAAHMCGPDAAADVVQETFLAVLRGSGRYDPARGTVGNYLFGIARHFVIRRLWTSRVPAPAEDLDDDRLERIQQDQPTVLESLTRDETVAAVRAAIATLPPVYREAIVLCELQEMSYEAAAAVVQCPVGTIRSRLHRARALLTTKLSAMHSPAAVRK
jgi:RNA polymerase sigma-70 factor (ECF subfamily)